MRHSRHGLALLTAGLLFVACGDSAGPEEELPPRQLSGTTTVPQAMASAPVVIGHVDWLISVNGAEITNIDAVGSSPYSVSDAVTVPGGSTSRPYTYTLPDDRDDFGVVLLAWIDENQNGLLDFPDEDARVPVKEIDGVDTPITGWGLSCSPIDSPPRECDYLAINPLVGNFGLQVVGASGFNFSF
jgi:hypothetical protein